MALGTTMAQWDLPGSVVPPENLHVTLRFVGETDIVGHDRLLAALDERLGGGPFSMRLGGLGAFPSARRATVLWVDVTAGTADLQRLHTAVESACDSAGLGREERPFRPHVTVSRLRPPSDVTALVRAVAPLDIVSPVDRVSVLRSHLGGGTPRYELLTTFEL